MLIGVMGDTHGDSEAIKQAVDAVGTVDVWLHCGDFAADGEFLAALTGLTVIGVSGNCDGMTQAKADEYFDHGSVKIWLTHGHHYHSYRMTEELVGQAGQRKAQVVVYGHTHVAYHSWHEGILVFNPGSPSRPRGGGFPSCGVLSIDDDGSVSARIVKVATLQQNKI